MNCLNQVLELHNIAKRLDSSSRINKRFL